MASARKTGLSRLLDVLYRASSSLAAVFLAAIALIILFQVGSRVLGFRVAGLDDLAAWSMGAAVFLALPNTLAQGRHIRVTLILERLPQKVAQLIEIAAALVGALISLWAGWAVLNFVGATFLLKEITQGEFAIPLWIPQLSMAAGFALLGVAFVDHLASTVAQTTSRPRSAIQAGKQLGEGL